MTKKQNPKLYKFLVKKYPKIDTFFHLENFFIYIFHPCFSWSPSKIGKGIVQARLGYFLTKKLYNFGHARFWSKNTLCSKNNGKSLYILKNDEKSSTKIIQIFGQKIPEIWQFFWPGQLVCLMIAKRRSCPG